MIIGVTGLIGSGKGAVTDWLVAHGFEKLGCSAIIEEEVVKRGMQVTRDTLRLVGNEVRKQEGAGVWAERLLARVAPGKQYVVEGFRNVAEIEVFRARKDFVLIGVAAGIQRRFTWMLERRRVGDPTTFAAFRALERVDFLEAEAYGQQNALCFSMADQYVVNEGSLEALHEQLAVLLEKYPHH